MNDLQLQELTPKITPEAFYEAFRKAASEVFSKPDAASYSRGQMTELVTSDAGVFTRTIQLLGRPELEGRGELYKIDYTIYDKRPIIGNKVEYRQPIYVHALIEHELGRNPEEEFWKLLHHYAPLKVLVFYSDVPQQFLDGFASTYHQVSSFHPRVASEQYLLICGNPNWNGRDWVAWRTSDFHDLKPL
ncbi:MAG: hypothetical protein FJ395_10630 [Verrucomicrobia bacterium]|nr:hypothetical protein [Verrucomicrobiota bacterium]